MVVGWLGGWLSAGSKGGARSSFRGTVALWDRGSGKGEWGRERVEWWSTRRGRGKAGGALGVVRMEPTGRRVEMGGDATWVEATTSKSDFRSTCYASASSIPSPPPDSPFPSRHPDRMRFPHA